MLPSDTEIKYDRQVDLLHLQTSRYWVNTSSTQARFRPKHQYATSGVTLDSEGGEIMSQTTKKYYKNRWQPWCRIQR